MPGIEPNVQVEMHHDPAMDEGSESYARFSAYLDRFVRVRIADERVTQVTFPEVIGEDLPEDHAVLERVDAYLTGTVKDEFEDVDIAPDGSVDERLIYETVRAVPYGTDASVEQLEQTIQERDPSRPIDAQQIRQALMDNPIPLLIPDHRVRDGPSGAPPIVEQRLRALEQPGT